MRNEPDILEEKMRALDRLAEAGCPVILVPAIERGVNDHEVGRIVRFALEHPAIFGINFQPAFHAGRHGEHDPMQRMSNPDVLRLIEEQTEGLFTTFRTSCRCLAASPPATRSPTPTLRTTTYCPLPRILDVEDYLDYISNRALPELSLDVQKALEGLWSSSAVPGLEKAMDDFAISCAACGLDLRPGPISGQHVHDHAPRLHGSLDLQPEERDEVLQRDLATRRQSRYPFCAYNSAGYREQARPQLAARQRSLGQEPKPREYPSNPPPLTLFDFNRN